MISKVILVGRIEHDIECGSDFVRVYSLPGMACYEWAIFSRGDLKEFSDNCYGTPEAALRDGLNFWFGEQQ